MIKLSFQKKLAFTIAAFSILCGQVASAKKISFSKAVRVEQVGICTSTPYKAEMDAANAELQNTLASNSSNQDFDTEACKLAIRKYYLANPNFDLKKSKISVVFSSAKAFINNQTEIDDSDNEIRYCRSGERLVYMKFVCELKIIDNSKY